MKSNIHSFINFVRTNEVMMISKYIEINIQSRFFLSARVKTFFAKRTINNIHNTHPEQFKSFMQLSIINNIHNSHPEQFKSYMQLSIINNIHNSHPEQFKSYMQLSIINNLDLIYFLQKSRISIDLNEIFLRYCLANLLFKSCFLIRFCLREFCRI